MSNLDESRELQIYLKNAFKKEIDLNDGEDNTDDDLDAVEEVYSNENHEIEKEQLKVYDYNESVAFEDGADNSIKGLVHIVEDGNPEETLNCPKCDYTTNKRFLLTRHIKIHSDERPFKCNVCDRGFKSNTALINHINMHLGKKPHQCKSCEMRFNTAGELARHTRYKHTHEKPHKCGECDYSSVELSKMRRHMRCHTGERPYQCPHCTYASPDSFKLKRHLRTHTGEKPYECDICLARFTQSNSLKSHKLIHSVGERPVFQCTLCPTTCGRKTDLQLHIQKLHTSDVPIKCKRCGKELPDRYTYKVHVKTHDGEKCYRCDICAYASISQRHLDMHKLIHTDEKPFRCEHCDLAFRHRQLLQRHINIYHTENYVPSEPQEKKHICPHCRRGFLRKGNLMRHMEIHDNKMAKVNPKTDRQIRKIVHTETNDDGNHDSNYNEAEVLNECSENDDDNTKEIDFIDEEDIEDDIDDEDCKFVEAFELVDDEMLDESVEAKEEKVECNFVYENNTQTQIDEIATTSRALPPKYNRRTNLVKTTTKTLPNNVFIVPTVSNSRTVATKKERLPIKIDLDEDDCEIEEDNENVVVIEVIEEDGMVDDTINSGEAHSIIAGDILEIPFQTVDKEESDDYEFMDSKEYVFPVEVAEED